jgi:RNA ligase (TIGR02306 family)
VSRDGSEFACEVVRVTAVEHHPNADRLDLVRFAMADGLLWSGRETAYVVVDQRGRRAPGQLAVYCSVDAVVPLDRPEFAFLKKPETTKPTHRLKAARFRGSYSEGLIVDAPPGAKFGEELAESWGVTYHNPQPAERGLQVAGAPKPPRRDWRRSALPDFDVTSLRKAPGLFAEGDRVVVTEKIHGTNFRFGSLRSPGLFGGRQWVVGSHHVYKTDNRSWLARLLGRRSKQGDGWYKEDLWCAAAEMYELEERCRRLARRVGFYAELFGVTETGKRIQDLDYGSPTLGVRVFDARDARSGLWLPWDEVRGATEEVGLKLVPEILSGELGADWLANIRGMAEGPSFLAAHIREGVVVRSWDGAHRGKWVGEGYRLRKE